MGLVWASTAPARPPSFKRSSPASTAPDTGSVTFGKDTVLGYMEQHVCRDFHKTAFDEVMTVFAPLLRLERELETSPRCWRSIPLGREDMERLISGRRTSSTSAFGRGGLTCRSRARSALLVWALESQLQNKVGVLSGGQKAKLQLAKMLLSGPTCCCWTSPPTTWTSRRWSGWRAFLLGYSGSYIVISHDRYFLDKVTNRTLEMEGKTVTSYKRANYSRYRTWAEQPLAMERVYEQAEGNRPAGHHRAAAALEPERNYVTIASRSAIDRNRGHLGKA